MTAAPVITKGIGAAMLNQVKRANENPERMRQTIEEQRELIEHLRARIRQLEKGNPAAASEPAADAWEQLGFRHYKQNGREAGTQTELAKRLKVGPDRISKWVKSGSIKTVTTPDDKQSVWLDQQKPARKSRQKQ